MPEFAYIRNALPAEKFEPIRDALLGSPLVSKSTLGGAFEQSHGFAMTFQEAGREQIEQRFPPLKDYFARVLGEPAVRTLQSWWGKLRKKPVVVPNCWYMNLLLVGEGGAISRHIDTTLGREAGVPGRTPEAVTVLYLKVPQVSGGQLEISREQKVKAFIRPREGGLLHFRGDLAHEVLPVQQLPEGAQRASLVIEQYHFADDALARLPTFKLDSRAGFGAYLKHHEKQGPGKEFELEP
jgi:hypothetical protein